MKSLHSYVDQMKQLLDQLTQVAMQLRDMSLQVISEEDLAPLQKHQEDLLSQIESIDNQIQGHYRHQLTSVIQEEFHNKLQIFQQLNQEFIQNLNANHGLIQFELHRAEDQEDQDFSGLHKILPSPDRPETIETQEKDKS